MSGCRGIGPLLDGYHDGELGAVERWRVRRHLLRCGGCRDELEGLEQLGTWVRNGLPEAGAPDPALWEAIARRLPVRAPQPVRRARSWLWAPPVAAALAAAGVAVLFLNGPGPVPDAPKLAAAASPRGVVQSIFAPRRPVMVFEAEQPDDPTIIWLVDELGEQTPEVSESVGL